MLPQIPTAIKRERKIEDYKPPVSPGQPPHTRSRDYVGLDLERSPDQHEQARDDWFVFFNSSVRRLLDVDLIHTLPHESVVHCVNISIDGQFVAAGCNKTAQIYDLISGKRICVLQDDSASASARSFDAWYINIVCFSPDGKYLATAGRNLIQVSD